MGQNTLVTRYPNGVSLHGVGALKNFPIPNFHQDWAVEKNDFHQFVAADWTITETQAGATQALISEQGGVLSLVNSAADNDVNQIQRAVEQWKFVAGKKSFFEARVSCSEATQTDLHVGLIITDTDLVGGITDGMYFRKDDGDTNIDFVSLKDSAGTTGTAVGTLAASTYVRLGFYFNGSSLFAFINDNQVFRSDAPVFCDDEELAVTFSQTNGDGNARTTKIDYYIVGQEIAR